MVSINKFVRGISLLTVVGFLASCSSSDDKSAAKVQEARPQQLTFSNPTPGTPVTRDQVDQIRSVFGQKPAISIPPTDLLLKDEDSKLENSQLNSLRYSEMMLQYTANPETYALYKAMRQNCRKQHGTLNLDFTVPLEKVTSVNDLKTGDHFISTAVGSYGGATCDVESDGKISYSAKVDKLETDGIASGEVTYGLKALMKNAHYAQLLRSKGVIVSSSASGIVSKQNVHRA